MVLVKFLYKGLVQFSHFSDHTDLNKVSGFGVDKRAWEMNGYEYEAVAVEYSPRRR